MAFDAESGLYSAYYNPYHLARIQAEIEASTPPVPERRCVCCLLTFGATCGAVTVAVGFYVRTPAITWPVVVVGLLGVILGIVLAHRHATGRGWRAGCPSIYTLAAMVLRRRQQRDEGQERRQVEVAQAQARAGQPWQHPSPLQPWRVAQVVGSRYHMPVYSACPLDLHPGGNDADGDGDGTRKEKGGKGGCTGSGNDCDGCNMPQHQPGHHEGEVLLDVGTAGQGGDATASSGGGSTPTTSSSSSRRSRSSSNNSSSCSRGCSTQDLKASAGGGSAAQGGAGGCGGGLGATPGPAPLSGWEVCGWAGEGAMVCGLPQSGLDGRVDVRPVLVLQPHWQHPAQLHAAHPSPPVPLPLPPPPPQQQPPEVGSPPAPPQAQPEPEAQPAQLPPLQQEQQEPREAWADVASESEARCGDGGPEATEAASSPKHPHAP